MIEDALLDFTLMKCRSLAYIEQVQQIVAVLRTTTAGDGSLFEPEDRSLVRRRPSVLHIHGARAQLTSGGVEASCAHGL